MLPCSAGPLELMNNKYCQKPKSKKKTRKKKKKYCLNKVRSLVHPILLARRDPLISAHPTPKHRTHPATSLPPPAKGLPTKGIRRFHQLRITNLLLARLRTEMPRCTPYKCTPPYLHPRTGLSTTPPHKARKPINLPVPPPAPAPHSAPLAISRKPT